MECDIFNFYYYRINTTAVWALSNSANMTKSVIRYSPYYLLVVNYIH